MGRRSAPVTHAIDLGGERLGPRACNRIQGPRRTSRRPRSSRGLSRSVRSRRAYRSLRVRVGARMPAWSPEVATARRSRDLSGDRRADRRRLDATGGQRAYGSAPGPGQWTVAPRCTDADGRVHVQAMRVRTLIEFQQSGARRVQQLPGERDALLLVPQKTNESRQRPMTRALRFLAERGRSITVDGEPEFGTPPGICWRNWSGSRYDACGDVRPMTWPSGSLKSPITIPTPGTSSGPIILVPPRLSAFSSAAPTSATWT